MSVSMQRALLRRACERFSHTLPLLADLPAEELLTARLMNLQLIGIASRGPVLALPWHPEPSPPDSKCRAANDDTFTQS